MDIPNTVLGIILSNLGWVLLILTTICQCQLLIVYIITAHGITYFQETHKKKRVTTKSDRVL